VPNRAARTLVTQRTDTVALVVSESEERFFAEPYLAAIVRGISAGLAGSGLQLLLAVAQSPQERESRSRSTAMNVDVSARASGITGIPRSAPRGPASRRWCCFP
jgi:DNA-binding LacI/PurR family transcriptional regulator